MTRDVIAKQQGRIAELERQVGGLNNFVRELQETIAEYELQLKNSGGETDPEMVLQLSNFAKFTPKELKLLSLLVPRQEGATKASLLDGLYAEGYSENEVPDIKIVDIFVASCVKSLKITVSSPTTLLRLFGAEATE